MRNDPARKPLYVKNILEGETHRKDREVFKALRAKNLLPATISHIEHIIHYDNQKSWDYLRNKVHEEFRQDHRTDPKKLPSQILTRYIDGIYDLMHDSFKRESYDNHNVKVNIFSNFGEEYNNAFWDGANLAFGRGDGIYFRTFVLPDIAAHEFTHAVVDHECKLIYQGQSGALNEHLADAFGIMFDMIYRRTDVKTSKWIIGDGLWTSRVKGVALRSMKAPGTAYDDPMVGSDPQPAHMSGFYKTSEDDGGVHIFSGIPNKAFYLANIAKGGRIHTNGIGRIWYNAMLQSSGLKPTATFKQFAQKTIDLAPTVTDKKILNKAWADVGIKTKITSGTKPLVSLDPVLGWFKNRFGLQ